jgi:hypothetical protein
MMHINFWCRGYDILFLFLVQQGSLRLLLVQEVNGEHKILRRKDGTDGPLLRSCFVFFASVSFILHDRAE